MEDKFKKFIWIKLAEENLFNNSKIKQLRQLAGGNTYTIIYLKLMLIANSDGIIEYEGLEKTIEEELALKIKEDPDNILVTMNYLKNAEMLEVKDNLEELNGGLKNGNSII